MLLLKNILSRIQQMQAHRGATAVEYALVVALVVVGLSATLGDLSTTSANAVEDRGDRIGNPQAYTNVVDPGGATGGVVGTDLEPPAEVNNAVHLETIVGTTSTHDNNRWNASVSVQVNSADNLPATAATVNGDWIKINGDGQVTDSVSASCATSSLGKCTMTIAKLKNSAVYEARFVFDSLVLTSTVYTWNSADDTTAYGTPATVVACRPDLPQNGDPCV